MPKHVPQGSKGFNPFADLIGLSFTKQESGWSKCQLNVEESLLNPYGMLHGGVIYSLADAAMGAALYSTMDESERCATVEMKIASFKPITSGILNCTVTVVHRSKRLGYLEAEVKSQEGIVDRASSTFSIYETRGNSQ